MCSTIVYQSIHTILRGKYKYFFHFFDYAICIAVFYIYQDPLIFVID